MIEDGRPERISGAKPVAPNEASSHRLCGLYCNDNDDDMFSLLSRVDRIASVTRVYIYTRLEHAKGRTRISRRDHRPHTYTDGTLTTPGRKQKR